MNNGEQFFNTAAGGYAISRSLRFNSPDSAYLSRTAGSPTSSGTWTFSVWIKRATLGADTAIIGGRSAGTASQIYFKSDNTLRWFENGADFSTTAVFRDVSSWYHFVFTKSGSTSCTIYVNGVQLQQNTTSIPSTSPFNTSGAELFMGAVGLLPSGISFYAGHYFADAFFIDGQALDPTSFGLFDTNGIWQPIIYTGSYGTNGFHLEFADNSTAAALGTDTSGAGNTWTVNNLTAAEYRVIDAPTLSNGAMIVRGASGGSVSVTISGTGNKNYFTSSDGINWTWQSTAASATYTANYVAAGGAGTNARIAIANGAFQYAMWNTNTNFDSTSNTTTDTTGLTFTTATANGSNGDSLVDVPTNGSETDTGVGGEVRGNYATLNPLARGVTALSNGNLQFDYNATYSVPATIGVASGKWYFEALVATQVSSEQVVGVVNGSWNNADLIGSNANGWGIIVQSNANNGQAYHSNSVTSSYATYANGDTAMVAFDVDTGKIWFGRNGTWFNSGNPASGTGNIYSNLAGTIFPAISNRASTGGVIHANFGQRPFAYTAPSGFKALCTANLPTPVITKPNQFFDVALYAGNSTARTITLPGDLSPDFVWVKSRSDGSWHILTDSVRGVNSQLYSNDTSSEGTQTDRITSFNSNGFSLGTNGSGGVNNSGTTYAAWIWDAGSSTVTNTQGSISSQVRANASAGFSIVSYTGTGSNATVGHGLNVAPSLLICKGRQESGSNGNWLVYHSALGNTKYLVLNATDAEGTSSGAWNNTSPTSTTFSIGTFTGGNSTSGNICYAFAPVVGYSSFGSYTGNGSADGPFVYTGFRVKWYLVKQSSASGENWRIIDATRSPYNVAQDRLLANSSVAEAVQPNEVDFLSNGFKFRSSDGAYNGSGATYIYAAFAESPFQYARAR
jgi:hypothetical protein